MKKFAGVFFPNQRAVFVHIVLWILYILFETSILIFIQSNNLHWLEIIMAFLLNITVFYVNAEYLLPKWANAKTYGLFAMGLAALVAFYLVASYVESRYIFPFAGTTGNTVGEVPVFTKLYVAQHLYRVTYFILLSFGYWFAKKAIVSETRLRIAEKEHYMQLLKQQELKREIAVSKLAFYRAQLNPHFFINTLNFFYSNIYHYSKDLAESMILLSNLMRYIIQKSESEALVPLVEEIEALENYLKLNQLRYDNTLQIALEVKGVVEHKKLAPFILMNLIENAFKYGDILDPDHPLIIDINVTDSQIDVHVENKIQIGNKPAGTGTGLVNLKKQLNLIYGEHYTLNIDEQRHKFKCHLKINEMIC